MYVDGSEFVRVVGAVRLVVVDAEDGKDGGSSTSDGSETGKVDVNEGATTGWVSVGCGGGDVTSSDFASCRDPVESSGISFTSCFSTFFFHPCFEGSRETFSLTLSLPENHSASLTPSHGAKASGNKSEWKSI